jgi:hypothetical protein
MPPRQPARRRRYDTLAIRTGFTFVKPVRNCYLVISDEERRGWRRVLWRMRGPQTGFPWTGFS